MTEDSGISEAELQAYVDGRLHERRRAEIDAWLAVRPEEAERVGAYVRANEELRAHFAPVLDEPLPERLERAARARFRFPWQSTARAAGWIFLGAVLGAMAGWQLHASRPVAVPLADGSTMARRAAVAHAVYSPEVRHPVEVGADQEQHLVTWLSKRLGVNVKAPKLDEAGMSLVGGRLLPGEIGPVAQLMYQTDRGRRMTLYVRAEAGGNRETAFRYIREKNVSVFYWIDRNCGYSIASADLSKEELLNVATMVYKQLEP